MRLPPSLYLALVGAGALGSELCRLLIEQEQRKVLLIDPDRVEPHNVPLSRMFQQGRCVGLAKVEVLAAQARRCGLPWQAERAEIADVGLSMLRGCDAILSATDSALARVETALAARTLRLPMLDAAVQPHGIAEGRVSWFAADPEAACYLCGLGENRRAELLGAALSVSQGCRLPEQETAMTGAPAAVRLTAATLLQVLAGELQRPAESALPASSFALRLGTHGPAQRVELTRSPSCPWHTLPPPHELLPLEHEQPIHDQLGPGLVLELPSPVCLRARCRSCGVFVEPLRRTAAVRRTLVCSGCGLTGTLDPLRSLASLTAADPLAARTPRQLGLPEGHLYHLRRTGSHPGSGF